MREAYVINSARRPDRMAAFQTRMTCLADAFRFVRSDAIDGGDLDLDAMLPSVRPERHNDLEPDLRVALGRALSHVMLWERIGRTASGPVLVLEDEANFLRQTRSRDFAAILAGAPSDMDILWLNDDRNPRAHRVRWLWTRFLRLLPSGPPAPPIYATLRGIDRAWRYWRWRAPAFRTLEAYLISPAAARFLASHLANDLVPPDIRVWEEIRRSNLGVYELRNPIFTQAG